MSDQEKDDRFFDHFAQHKPTKIGKLLVRNISAHIAGCAKLRSGESVLEIGPGRAYIADFCLAKGASYYAIEPNQKMADVLEKRGIQVKRGLVPPIEDFGIDFDVVFLVNVMEHMSTADKAMQLASEVYKILKPGGRFVVCSPEYLNWKELFYHSDFSHNYITTRLRLHSLLINSGFENIKSWYRSGFFGGFLCLIFSFIAAKMPFAFLRSCFPNNIMIRRLDKLQMSFLRKVVAVGVK